MRQQFITRFTITATTAPATVGHHAKKMNMKVFPKSISEKIWREHLTCYSRTLVEYTSDLNIILSGQYTDTSYNNIYVCPLCLNNYFVNTKFGVKGNSEFSLDHVPPESIGGKYKILTCKKCNNDSGAFESELKKLLNFGEDEKDENLALIPKVKILDSETGKYVKGTLKVNRDRSDIVFDENVKKYNPDYVDFLNRINLRKAKELSISIELYDKQKIERALLKSAYLICFIWWGYEFVFSRSGSLIRNVIQGKLKYPSRVPILWDIDQISSGIHLLSDDKNRLAFVVNIRLKGMKANTAACILIPNPNENGWEELEKINHNVKSNHEKGFNFTQLPRIVHRIGYTISWNIVIPDENKK